MTVLARLRRLDVFVLTASLWFIAKFLRYSFPPLFPTFRNLYGVSNAELGAVFSALMLGYAAMQFPSGAFADRFGMVRVITGGALVTTGAALVLATGPTYLVLVAAVVLVGIGTGAHKTVAITLLSTVYPERTGRVLGTMDTLGELGGVTAPAVVVVVLSWALGWSTLFLGGALVCLVLAWLFARLVGERFDGGATRNEAASDAAPDGGTPDVSTAERLRSYGAAFGDPRFAAFVGATMLYSFVTYGVTAFLPLYLVDTGLSNELAGVLYSGFFLAGVVQPVTGDLGDRLGELRVIAGTLGLATVGLGVLLVAGETGTLVLGGLVLTLGVGLHGTRPCRDAYLVAVIPDAVTGGTLGVVRTGMMTAAAISPAIVGILSDWIGFSPAFFVLATALVVAVALVVGLVLTHRRT